MILRVLLAFLGGFALAVAGALAWLVAKADGQLPRPELVGAIGLGCGVVAAAITWFKLRPRREKPEVVALPAAPEAETVDANVAPKARGLSLPKIGKARREAEEPVVETFQRKRGPAGLASATMLGETIADEPEQDADLSLVVPASMIPLPEVEPVVVQRRERNAAEDWAGARSWLGGLPRLGDIAWPVGPQSGLPLPFGAQIDLAELARVRPANPLPKAGWLAFFLDEGAVVHVPARASGDRHSLTPVPQGAQVAYEPEGAIFPAEPTPYARASFPYWPVELLPVDVAHWDAEDLPLTWADFPSSGMLWWRSVRLFVEQLQRSLYRAPDLMRQRQNWLAETEAQLASCQADARLDPELLARAEKAVARNQAKVEALEREIAGLPAVIGLLSDYAEGGADWARLTPADKDDFDNTFAAIKQQFPALIKHYTAGDVERLAALTMHEMFTGNAAAFAALPDEQRQAINASMRRPHDHAHQIFGTATDIHGGATDLQGDNVLLLQLVDDEMIQLRINSGVFSFWLDPANIADKAWDRAKVLVEC